MENTAAKTATPVVTAPVGGTTPTPQVPHVDPKATLKIETTQTSDEKKVNYGEKLFLLGTIFFVIIIICVGGVIYFWTQNGSEIQKPVTIETSKK